MICCLWTTEVTETSVTMILLFVNDGIYRDLCNNDLLFVNDGSYRDLCNNELLFVNDDRYRELYNDDLLFCERWTLPHRTVHRRLLFLETMQTTQNCILMICV